VWWRGYAPPGRGNAPSPHGPPFRREFLLQFRFARIVLLALGFARPKGGAINGVCSKVFAPTDRV
jgi:hypothetical protein